MASQISHIVYAKKYLNLHPMKEADDFLLGTLFPDLRRISKEVRRRETHSYFEELNLNFEGLTAFLAGWKFHLWCDMKRIEILNKYDFFKLKYSTDFDGLVARLLEDEILYDKYKNWEKLSHLLNSPPIIKAPINVSQETIERWYAIVGKYFEKKPNDQTMKIFISKQSSLAEEAKEIIDAIGKLRNNRKAVEILPKISEEILEV